MVISESECDISITTNKNVTNPDMQTPCENWTILFNIRQLNYFNSSRNVEILWKRGIIIVNINNIMNILPVLLLYKEASLLWYFSLLPKQSTIPISFPCFFRFLISLHTLPFKKTFLIIEHTSMILRKIQHWTIAFLIYQCSSNVYIL